MDKAAHPPVEQGVESDDLNTTTITMVGLISAALVLASALGVKALYEMTVVNLQTANQVAADVRGSAADSVINQQERTLEMEPRQIPGQQGVYSMPIKDAMELVVKELSAEQKQE